MGENKSARPGTTADATRCGTIVRGTAQQSAMTFVETALCAYADEAA